MAIETYSNLKIKYTISKSNVIFIHVFLIYSLYIFFNLKEFHIWPQIIEDFNINEFNPHYIRIVLINSLMAFYEFITSTDSRVIQFDNITKIILFLNIYLLVDLLNKYKTSYINILCSIFPLFVSFFQNGRGIYACFAITLLLYVTNNKKTKYTRILLLLSFLFSNVTSGVFSAYFIVFIILLYMKKIDLNNILKLLIFSIMCYIFYIYLMKNIEYYDGSIILMLTHGLGKYLINDVIIVLPILMLLLLSLIMFILFYFRYSKIILKSNYLPFIIASIIGLAFGFTSFFSFIYFYFYFIYINAFNISSSYKKILNEV